MPLCVRAGMRRSYLAPHFSQQQWSKSHFPNWVFKLEVQGRRFDVWRMTQSLRYRLWYVIPCSLVRCALQMEEKLVSFRNFGKFLPNCTASLAQTDGQRIGSYFGWSCRGQFDIASSFVCLRGTEEDRGLRRVRLDIGLPGSEGNTSHHAQVGGPFTVGFATKFLCAFIIIITTTYWLTQSLSY